MRFSYRNELSELETLAQNLETFGDENDVNPAIIHAFNLCLDEILTNIISYGFEDVTEHDIYLEIHRDGEMIVATMVDNGKAFNPLTDSKDPDLETSIEDREIGGLGIFFLKQMMDELDYQRMEGYNRLTMRKKNVELPD
ncbi:ATP-binding protein [Cerasicoccus arenae]|uniref:Histidine kinase n=1 Tax=Cerasicoccus arenae TaxID=424488 RepID=A0A8J3DGX4_9BACT|nr:ATP-binding protein [Cerasicoccus arenae]MBK1857292.1 ATP-binding protein [Cerasicoccus arenae]GHC00502.1 histidine kinase [Cerasicoccus arenae]